MQLSQLGSKTFSDADECNEIIFTSPPETFIVSTKGGDGINAFRVEKGGKGVTQGKLPNDDSKKIAWSFTGAQQMIGMFGYHEVTWKESVINAIGFYTLDTICEQTILDAAAAIESERLAAEAEAAQEALYKNFEPRRVV